MISDKQLEPPENTRTHNELNSNKQASVLTSTVYTGLVEYEVNDAVSRFIYFLQKPSE